MYRLRYLAAKIWCAHGADQKMKKRISIWTMCWLRTLWSVLTDGRAVKSPADGSSRLEALNKKMAEYARAILCHGRPHFHISPIADVFYWVIVMGENDATVVPNIGMLASF